MRKRLPSLAQALAVCLSLTFAAHAAASFPDVPSGHWAYAEIQKCAEQGVVVGYSDGSFGPGKTVTGAQFVSMLARVFYPAELNANNAFSSRGWAVPALRTASNANLLAGTSRLAAGQADDWKDSGNLTLNRYDMAQILNNLLAAKNTMATAEQRQAAQSAIKDWNQIPGQYQAAVSNCYALGVLSGMGDGSFSGNSTMDRAQACAVINRVMNRTSGTGAPNNSVPAGGAPTGGSPVNSAPTSGASNSGSGSAGNHASRNNDAGTAAAPQNPPSQQSAAKTSEDLSAEVIELVNQERAKQGLSPLGTLSGLTAAAQARAPELPELFSHTRPNGSRCFTALEEARVSYYAAGENIAAGSNTAEGVMQMWMNSPGHKANILGEKFTHIGVACVQGRGGYYWVQMFVGSNAASESGGTDSGASSRPDAGSGGNGSGSAYQPDAGNSGSGSGSPSQPGAGNGGNGSGSASQPGAGNSGSGSGSSSQPDAGSGSSAPSAGKNGVVCSDLPSNGRTTHYREEWNGQYMDLQIEGDTIQFTGCLNLDESLYNYAVVWAFGAEGYTPFTSGSPFSTSVQVDLEALDRFYDGDSSKANSYVLSQVCQNYTPGDSGMAGVTFPSGADVMLALDGDGGMEFQIRRR